MTRTHLFLFALAAGLAAGCAGSAPPRSEVTGTVTLGGQPVNEGLVTLHGPDGREVTGAILPGGSYVIADPPPGVCQVTVKDVPAGIDLGEGSGSGHAALTASKNPRVPKRYGEPGNGLSIDVRPGTQTYPIVLTP